MTASGRADPNDQDRHEASRRLQELLATGQDERIGDDDVRLVLGPDAVPAFRYAQAALAGSVRRTTREPSFCHSADIALRASDLGFDSPVVIACLLHDTVEDRSRTLIDASRWLEEVADRFGAEVARDVRILTNRYLLVIEPSGRHIPRDLPFNEASVRRLRDGLEIAWSDVPPAVRREFEYEFHQAFDWFLPRADVSGGERVARVDRAYTVLHEVLLQAYKLFIEEIADDARQRLGPEGAAFHDTCLTAKSLDFVDNLRTTEVASWTALERISLKTEIFLDGTFFLHELVHGSGFPSMFPTLYDYVKLHLIEQLAERRSALAQLLDTRFGHLADYLVQQILRLQRKYKVGDSRLEDLARLRLRIQAANGVENLL
jgi:hypothetical protein